MTFYTHYTDLQELSHPVVSLRSTSILITLRVPQDRDLQALINILTNPENTKNDLSVALLNAEDRRSICRQWLTLNEPLSYMNFVIIIIIIIDTENGQKEAVGIAGLGWIGPTDSKSSGKEDNDDDDDNDDADGSKRAGAAGIMVNSVARRKGIGSEAIKIVIDYGLKELGLIEVRVGTPSSNTAMRRLMEVKFQIEPEVEKEVDRFGNDLLWRISRGKWPILAID